MKRGVAVTGAAGFVGRKVVEALRTQGARVIALGRRADLGFGEGVEARAFDPNGAPNPEAFAGVDAVVHLAGESVAGRWTPERKRAIEASRVQGTRTLVESLRALERRPSVLVSASAVGYYGDRADQPLTESSAPGSDFLSRVCIGWEDAARQCESLGIRTVCLRTGIVLGAGGALSQMQPPFKLGVGGPLGSGRQFVPWIHLDDLAALYCFVVENPQLRGPVNGVAPDYATNARFAQALGAALRRPALVPAPAIALGAILGEFASSLLASQLVIPAAALDAGFRWQHPSLEEALVAILRPSARPPFVHTFTAVQFVPRPLPEVFDFFSDPRNLAAITPPSLAFAIRSAPQRSQRGALVAYDLRLHGLPIHWKTLIAEFEPMRRFVDVQLRGPYLLWRHLHEFRPIDGGVEVADQVDYLLPWQPLSRIAVPLAAREIREIFRFRREALAARFP